MNSARVDERGGDRGNLAELMIDQFPVLPRNSLTPSGSRDRRDRAGRSAAGCQLRRRRSDRPDITEQPIDRIVIHGSNVVFSVEAIGEEPIMYQWQFNGMNLVDDMEGHINGSITDTLEIDDVGTNDAGSYSVVVSHGDVSTNSDLVTLTVVGLQGMIPTSEVPYPGWVVPCNGRDRLER